MCDAIQVEEKDEYVVASNDALGVTEDECDRVRKELEALRSKRTTLKSTRCKEIELHESQYQNTKAKLERRLTEHAHIKTYRQFLQYYQREYQENSKDASSRCMVPASTYIIQQETPLLSAMHRSFCVLPHQRKLIRMNYEHDIFPYMRKEIEALNLDALEVSNQWMKRLSDQGEEIDVLYDKYRMELENIEMEVRKYRCLLTEKTLNKEGKKDCDDSSILSDTDRSESDDDSSSREEAGVGILKEALNLFNSSSHHRSSLNTFFHSFTVKDDCNDT